MPIGFSPFFQIERQFFFQIFRSCDKSKCQVHESLSFSPFFNKLNDTFIEKFKKSLKNPTFFSEPEINPRLAKMQKSAKYKNPVSLLNEWYPPPDNPVYECTPSNTGTLYILGQ